MLRDGQNAYNWKHWGPGGARKDLRTLPLEAKVPRTAQGGSRGCSGVYKGAQEEPRRIQGWPFEFESLHFEAKVSRAAQGGRRRGAQGWVECLTLAACELRKNPGGARRSSDGLRDCHLPLKVAFRGIFAQERPGWN